MNYQANIDTSPPIGQAGFIEVTLSDRNLLDLLSQRMKGRGRNQDARPACLSRRCGNVLVQVTVESDQEHYKDRVPGPGSNPWKGCLGSPRYEDPPFAPQEENTP